MDDLPSEVLQLLRVWPLTACPIKCAARGGMHYTRQRQLQPSGRCSDTAGICTAPWLQRAAAATMQQAPPWWSTSPSTSRPMTRTDILSSGTNSRNIWQQKPKPAVPRSPVSSSCKHKCCPCFQLQTVSPHFHGSCSGRPCKHVGGCLDIYIAWGLAWGLPWLGGLPPVAARAGHAHILQQLVHCGGGSKGAPT